MFLFNQLLIHASTRKLGREHEVMYTFLADFGVIIIKVSSLLDATIVAHG